MTEQNSRLQYIKDVLGVKSVILPADYVAKTPEVSTDCEFSFQTLNQGPVLFLSDYSNDTDKIFTVEELQLLEKIIVALKLKFERTDIAKIKTSSKTQLLSKLQSTNYSYVFLLGSKMTGLFNKSNEFKESNITFFATFHPKDMILNPDLKKEAWFGFKNIMENLPR